jgi:hypothetical protein
VDDHRLTIFKLCSKLKLIQIIVGNKDAVMVWCGANSIAVSTRELSVRCLDLETNDNYLLTLDNPSDREHFICLDFNPQRSILCGGTSLGRVAIWKHSPSAELDPENAWKLQVKIL